MFKGENELLLFIDRDFFEAVAFLPFLDRLHILVQHDLKGWIDVFIIGEVNFAQSLEEF